MQKTNKDDLTDKQCVQSLVRLEDLIEKKTKIYARLLTEPIFAEEMSQLANRHKGRKERLQKLLLELEQNENKGRDVSR